MEEKRRSSGGRSNSGGKEVRNVGVTEDGQRRSEEKRRLSTTEIKHRGEEESRKRLEPAERRGEGG